MKVAVVYWSGTGNTEIIAQAITKSAKKKPEGICEGGG